jgi:hypothetical protein
MNGLSGNGDSELGLSRISVSNFGFEATTVIGSSRKAFFHQSSLPPPKDALGQKEQRLLASDRSDIARRTPEAGFQRRRARRVVMDESSDLTSSPSPDVFLSPRQELMSREI